MAWKQDIAPNVNIACRPGWCEQYVRQAFGQPAKYATATAAWNGQEDKHTDRNHPGGVAVAAYWAVTGEPAGHVAVWNSDGSVWSASHPTSTSPIRFANLEAIERYYGGRLQWRGWGTYVSHARVAHYEEEPAPVPTPEPTPEPSVPTHTVKPNETLGQIILDEGWNTPSGLWGANGDVARIAKANGIANPDLIHPGQVITKA